MTDEWTAPDEPGVAVAVQRETLVPGALRAARQAKRMSLRTMAQRLGMSKSWVNDVEAGRGEITPAMVKMWSTITGRHVDDLYGVHREAT